MVGQACKSCGAVEEKVETGEIVSFLRNYEYDDTVTGEYMLVPENAIAIVVDEQMTQQLLDMDGFNREEHGDCFVTLLTGDINGGNRGALCPVFKQDLVVRHGFIYVDSTDPNL